MNADLSRIEINGVSYVRADSMKDDSVKSVAGLQYSIVRSYAAGVFAGYINKTEYHDGIKECEVLEARRIFYWDGAASLSQLSQDGTSKPKNCKFTMIVPSVVLSNVIEVLPLTAKAKKSIDSVAVWSE